MTRTLAALTTRVAVLVAPYTPGSPATNLGAAKKIELVASLLRRLGFAVHLVDSSHSEIGFRAPVHAARREIEGHELRYWRPFCLPSRKLGKLFNVFLSGALFRRVATLRPDLVWIYNSYALEARLGLYLRSRTACRLAFELEDLPRARPRGLNPKPILDQMCFEALLRRADLTTFVNAALMARLAGRTRGKSLLFPSILKRDLVAPVRSARFDRAVHRLGYFGGLEPDKGVAVLLDLLPLLPDSWELVITGAGTLEQSFRAARAAFPAKLKFYGRVSHERVAQLMQDCDAIVNPHASISNMRDGVFPFKVCEAVASGALVISTALPPIDVELAPAVQFYDGGATALARALAAAPRVYEAHVAEIGRVASAVRERYGEEAVLRDLAAALQPLFSDAESTRSPQPTEAAFTGPRDAA